ncbi:MAG: DUF1566 domain-containing protein [Pseudomonadota bacterium]
MRPRYITCLFVFTIILLFPIFSFSANVKEIGRDGVLIAFDNGVVKDTKTGLEWIAGPDKDMNWYEAKSWVESLDTHGGDWRMPILLELKTLHRQGKGTRNISPLLKTTGWFIWSVEERDTASAWSFNLTIGAKTWGYRELHHQGRAFATRYRR